MINATNDSLFPEFSGAHLTDDCRAHLLGAASCWKAAHAALLRGDLDVARAEIDRAINIAQEARKYLNAPSATVTSDPTSQGKGVIPERNQ